MGEAGRGGRPLNGLNRVAIADEAGLQALAGAERRVLAERRPAIDPEPSLVFRYGGAEYLRPITRCQAGYRDGVGHVLCTECDSSEIREVESIRSAIIARDDRPGVGHATDIDVRAPCFIQRVVSHDLELDSLVGHDRATDPCREPAAAVFAPVRAGSGQSERRAVPRLDA